MLYEHTQSPSLPLSLSHTHVYTHTSMHTHNFHNFSSLFHVLCKHSLQQLASCSSSSHSAECQLSTQPLIMVSASKRQLDSKCHPALCGGRTRTHPAERVRGDVSQSHHRRNTLGTWVSTGISEVGLHLLKTTSLSGDVSCIFSISLWPKPTLKFKCMRQIMHFMLFVCILLFLAK